MTQRQYQRVVFQPATYKGMQKGINQMVDAVRPTLGPHPRVVAIERIAGRDKTPELLDNGALIVRRILELPDRDADMGAMFIRQVLWRVHEKVGDGTATTGVLFQSIFNQGVRYIVSGGNAMQLHRFLAQGMRVILEKLDSLATPLEGEQRLVQMAESICYDRPLAALLGEIFDIVGEYGQLDIRTGRSRELERQYVEGMYWDGGIYSRQMINNKAEMKAEIQNAAVLISDLDIEDPYQVAPVLEATMQAGIPALLIVAKGLSDSVTALLLSASRDPDKFQVIAAKTPGASSVDQLAALKDLSVLVGGRPISRAAGETLNSCKLDDLGRVRRAWANRFHFGIVGGKGDPRALRTHISELRAAHARTTESEAQKKLQERIGKLIGGSATLWVGGVSEKEIEVRKELAQRTADALRSAAREGIVPGGGVAFLACRSVLQQKLKASTSTDERTAYNILATAMEVPARTILTNAGYDASEVMAEIRLAGKGRGFDVRSGQVVDMIGAGVWDALSVLKAAAHGAVAGAALALTTDVLVHHKDREKAMQP
jgi:chaperonin GroEL